MILSHSHTNHIISHTNKKSDTMVLLTMWNKFVFTTSFSLNIYEQNLEWLRRYDFMNRNIRIQMFAAKSFFFFFFFFLVIYEIMRSFKHNNTFESLYLQVCSVNVTIIRDSTFFFTKSMLLGIFYLRRVVFYTI